MFAGVDQVGVHFILSWERADAKQAILGLQRNVHAFGDVVRHQRRDADAEIDVVTVAQLLRSALRHQLADRIFFFCGRAALYGAELNPFFVLFSLDDAVDENARRVDLVGIKLANLDELLHLSDADFAAAGDHRIKVP